MLEWMWEEESGRRLRRLPETANPRADGAVTIADNDRDVRPVGEQAVLDEVRINDGGQLRRCRVRAASKPRSRASMRSATRHYARADVPGIIYGAGCDGFPGVDEYVDLDSPGSHACAGRDG